MRELELDPIPAGTLDSLHARFPRVADAIEECLDWVEADPVDLRAKRRRFTNGMRAVVRSMADSEWAILWDEIDSGHPVIHFIGEAASL